MGYSRFFQNTLVSGARGLASKVAKKAGELVDPCISDTLFKIQRAQVLTRADGRTIRQLVEQGGLLQRVSYEDLLTVSHWRVEQYQQFNAAPFGYGACTSMEDLLPFINGNSQTNDATIYKFYGRAVSLSELKLRAGMETHGHDDECEYIVTETIPLEQFLGATCPKYRDKLLLDLEVPNLMHEFNPQLPKTMRMSDFNSPGKVLSWLLMNESEKVFEEVCTYMYADLPEEVMERQLQGNSAVMERVRLILSRSQLDTSL